MDDSLDGGGGYGSQCARREEVVVIMGPTLLWEMQTPSLFDGRWGVFFVSTKKKRRVTGELLEQLNCLISHNMIGLWG
jgi:hypothetical protein